MLPHHKGKELSKKDMLRILEKLDSSLEGIQRKIKLYGVGGTVLVLSDLRSQSKDVDFIVSREDFKTLSGPIAEMELKKQVQFDLFPNGLMPNYQYSRYNVHAKKSSLKFKNIEIYYLDKIDLVLTKALAGRNEDLDDIKLIAPSKDIIPKKELIERFENVIPTKNKEEEIKNKFERFISEFYK